MKRYLLISCLIWSFSLFAQEKGLTPISKASTEIGQTFAVVVGISDYQDEGIPDLRFADKDALAFAGFLQSPAGGSLDEDHLKVLINEQATAAQFAIALDWLWEVVKENDRVIIYFSGHGDVERKSITQPGYLLCWDAPSRVYMAGGAFNVRDLNDVVSTLSVQNKAKVILVTDACRAGKLSGSGIGGSQATAANLAKQYANEIKILSCQPDEYSIEGEQWGGGRGAFSYHLLDGLVGLADGNEDLSVDLKEIGRYLEDFVTEEVAPQSQNPMVIGNKTESLAHVFPEMLAQIKEGKKGQMQLLTSTESRGIEDEVLAKADSSIVRQYLAFKQSLKDKQFLEPATACANFYYEKLSKESSLERLHSSMRRNYAAALQDDAQQVLNRLLDFDPNICYITKKDFLANHGNYPRLIERSAELLGESHYMYKVLKARQYWFEGYLKNLGIKESPDKDDKLTAREKFKLALSYQPEMPQAHLNLGSTFIFSNEPDSAEYHLLEARKLAPGWIYPYTALYLNQENQGRPDLGEKWLDQAWQIDSNQVVLLNSRAKLFQYTNRIPQAIEMLERSLKLDSTIFCTWNNLGTFYIESGTDLAKGEYLFKKAMTLDSNNFRVPFHLGIIKINQGNPDSARMYLQQAIEMDSTFGGIYTVWATTYQSEERFDEAEAMYLKSIKITPQFAATYMNYGKLKLMTKDPVAADSLFRKGINLGPNKISFTFGAGQDCIQFGEFKIGEKYLDECIEMGGMNGGALFFKAVSRTMQNQPKDAVKYIEESIKAGNKDYIGFRSFPGIQSLWQREDFKTLMKKYFPDQYEE